MAAALTPLPSPYLYPEKWKKMSKEVREHHNIKQEDIQPGNMKVQYTPSCITQALLC